MDRVYLGSDPKKHRQESGELSQGREGSQSRGYEAGGTVGPWGLIPLGTTGTSEQHVGQSYLT